MILGYVQYLKSQLHDSFVARLPWLENFLGQVLDMLSSPLTGIKTRYHWVQLVETIFQVALVFWLARGALGIGLMGLMRYAFPKGIYRHPSSIVDYKLNVVNYFTGSFFNLTWRLGTPLMTIPLVGLLTALFGPSTHAMEWNNWSIVIFAVLLYFADDLGYYIFHYASHKIPFIWAFHKVHHSAELLTIFTAGRVHPMEYAFVAPTKAVTTSFVIAPAIYFWTGEPSVIEFYGISMWVILSGMAGEQLLHSHVWLSYGPKVEWFLLSPAQHQIHHSSAPQHWDRNFAGRFALWDWIFGTIYIPKGYEKIPYGITGETRQLHPGLISAYVRPYWDIMPMKRTILGLATMLFGDRATALAKRWHLEPSKPPAPIPTWLPALLAAAGVLVVLAGTVALQALWMVPNHDNDWWLIVTQRMIQGGRYLYDFMETNPPMMMFLLLPPVMAEAVTGIDRYALFVVHTAVMIGLVIALSWPILRGLTQDRPLATSLIAIALAAWLCVLPGYDFGQREHIFAILFLPGLFWLAAREAGRPSPFNPYAAIVIVLATMAMLIKPFYLIVLAPLFLLRLPRLGWRATLLDPAAWLIVGVVLAFVGIITLWFPDYFAAAALHWQVYFAFERAWITVVMENRDAFAALFLAIALLELLPVENAPRIFLRHVWGAAAMCLLMGVVQKKGFPYQFLPVRELAGFILIVTAVLVLRPVAQPAVTQPAVSQQSLPQPLLPWPAALAAVATIMVQGGLLAMRPIEELRTFSRPYNEASPIIQTLREVAHGKSLLVIDSGFRTGIPYLVGAQLVGRAPSQLLLPGTVRLAEGNAADRTRAAAMKQVATAQLADDLDRNRPAIVAVHSGGERQALPNDFDILGFYNDDPAFRRAWADYALISSARGWDFYQRRSEARASRM